MKSERYVPALAFDFLTGWYDPVVSWTTRERTFRKALLAQMKLVPGETVLDVGCGTGTFLSDIAAVTQHVDLVGIDGDNRILQRAHAKVALYRSKVRLVRALAAQLPFESDSFSKVSCSLFLHHLERAGKIKALQEMHRVLRPKGQLHIADWGKPSSLLMEAAFLSVRILDGFSPTRDHASGELPLLVREAGFKSVETTEQFSTPCGTITLLRAVKSDSIA